MIITIYALIATCLFTRIEAMTPQDNLSTDNFIPKAHCLLSQKMQRTIENLPRTTKKIATDLFQNALIKQEPLNLDLLKLMNLYGNHVSLSVSNGSHDYGSMKLTQQIGCYLELTFKTSLAVANLFRNSAPKCYIKPEQLIAESCLVEDQVATTQCILYPTNVPSVIESKKLYIKDLEFYTNLVYQALPKALHASISDKNRRPIHRLVMLAYDIQYAEKAKKFKSAAINDMRDIHAHLRNEMLSLCVVQQYTGSRTFERITNTNQCITSTKNPYVKLVIEQLQRLAPDRCSWYSQAESYASQFIENVKKIAIVDNGIFS